jgi:hypothetical protein
MVFVVAKWSWKPHQNSNSDILKDERQDISIVEVEFCDFFNLKN